jgi:3-dehydroquinate synthase
VKKIHISADRDYDVIIDVDSKTLIQELSATRTRVAIFFSEKMRDALPTFEASDAEFFFFPIPDGESGKSTAVLTQSWNWLGAAGFTRDDLIIGIGGGAVTDFAGFVASSWLRGIDWVAVPTTVAGMVDASIGGKTGINSDYGKNLIGAFYSPITVIIDPQWLTTLSDRDFAAGLAEVVKCGFIRDVQILNLLRGKGLNEIRESRELTIELIERSAQVKADVVSGDFKESFDREILNYGHTFGHAVESHSRYTLRHGECVAIGMAFIAHLAAEVGVMNPALVDEHLRLLKTLNLPTTYSQGQWPELHALMKLDKKSRGNSLRFVVITEIGKTQRLENPNEGALLSAYEKVCQ